MYSLDGSPIPDIYQRPAKLLNDHVSIARKLLLEALQDSEEQVTALIYEHDNGSVEVAAAPIALMAETMISTGCAEMAKELLQAPPSGMAHSIIMTKDGSVTLIAFELVSSIPSHPELN